MTNRSFVSCQNAVEIAEKASTDLVQHLSKLLEAQSVVTLALTGGTVGIKTLERLATKVAGLDLNRIQLWWTDERFVEPGSSESNFVQAEAAFVSKVRISKDNLHPMPASNGQGLIAAAKIFAEQIEAESPRFDVVLLGVGQDGHIASLFPNSKPVEVGNWVVAESNSPKAPSERISLSYEAINSAKQVWFLVSGSDKADAVYSAIVTKNVPAAIAKGTEKTVWYLDREAASKITF